VVEERKMRRRRRRRSVIDKQRLNVGRVSEI
jgi:hypothetical protein